MISHFGATCKSQKAEGLRILASGVWTEATGYPLATRLDSEMIFPKIAFKARSSIGPESDPVSLHKTSRSRCRSRMASP